MKRHVNLALALGDVEFFRDFSEQTLARVADCVHHREYELRQIIYFPDDRCDYVYWVRSGRVRVSRMTENERQVTFRHIIPGEIFGEECLLEAPTRDSYAEAMEPTLLCLLRADDFRRLANAEAQLGSRVAQSLCRRAQAMENVYADTIFKSVMARVAACIGRLRRQQMAVEPNNSDDPNVLRLTHQEIANLAGCARETISIHLKAMREERILELANRRIKVIDAAALENKARSKD